MEMVKAEHFKDEPIIIDEKYFHGCTFNNCLLIYQGGEMPSFEKCELNECEFSFKGAAGNTITFLAILYHIGFKSLVEGTFSQMKNWKPENPEKFKNNNFEGE